MIYRYPRYGELFEAREAQQDVRRARRLRRRRISAICRCSRSSPGSTKNFRSTIPKCARWIEKGRDYSLDDQALMGAKQREIVGQVIPAYQAAGGHRPDRNFDHARSTIRSCRCSAIPISPVCRIPHVPLPPRSRYPGGRAHAVANGARLYRARLRRRAVGLWPSEGSVSDEVFSIAAEIGLRVGRHR